MMEYYKVINTLIVTFLSTLVVVNWRNAMGVGAFLSARYISISRDYMIKYREYESLGVVNEAIHNSKRDIYSKYKRDIWLYFGFSSLSLVALCLFLFNSVEGYIDGKIVSIRLIEALFQEQQYGIFLGVLMLTISIFVVIFSHTKIETFSFINLADKKLQEAINQGKNQELEEVKDGK